MSKEWIYARISQSMAEAGGPEKWLSAIKKAEFAKGYDKGTLDMKNKLVLPLIIAGAGIGVVSTLCAQSISKCVADKREEKMITILEAEEAEKYLKEELNEAIKSVENDSKE